MSHTIDRTGETKNMKNEMSATIISYRKWEDIDVKFEDGYIAYNKSYGSFKKGDIKNPNIKIKSKILISDRIGEISSNIYGTKLELIKYNNYDDIDVKIYDKDNTIIKNTRYKYFKSGHMFSPYDKTINNIGYIGIPIFNKEERNTPMCKLLSYLYWVSMINRCYNNDKLKTYKNCFVCEEWLNYSNFKKWFDINYYEIPNKKMQLDKDILVKGNKIYSPVTCVFVPNDINMLFVKADNIRGDLPIGVHHDRNRNCYSSKLSIGNKTKTLGRFSNVEEAFNIYKQNKEKYIKQVADEYKDKIPLKLYEAMIKYTVEITD